MTDAQAKAKMHGIEVVEFSMPSAPSDQSSKSGSFDFEITAETRLGPEQKLIICFVSVNVRNAKEEPILASIKVGVGFELENFNEIVKVEDDNNFILPFKEEAMTRRIAISTTRGVMFNYFKGTHLHRAILPIVPELLKPEKALVTK